MRDLRHRQAALGGLAAGHRHRVVVEDLVGDVDAGRRGGAQRQQAGMGVGAVAEILEHMLFAGERRLPDPGHALGAHMRDRGRCGGSASTAPCRDSRCRPSRGCPRAPWSKCCAGSPSRNTACAAALSARCPRRAGRTLRAWPGAAPAPGCDGRACASAPPRRPQPWSASARLRSATAARRSRRACRPPTGAWTHRRCRECASTGPR